MAEDQAQPLLEAGAEIAGAATTVALARLFHGAAGDVAGVIVGPLLRATLTEMAARTLGDRERVRIGAAVAYTAEHLAEREADGGRVRDDGFFTDPPSGRSAAKEVAEGVLLAAQREHEEQKVRHLGYLLASIAFEPQIDRYLANWLIQTAGELSWAQHVLLAAIGGAGGRLDYHVEIGSGISGWDQWGLHQQLADLGYGKRELIGAKGRKTERLGFNVPNTVLAEQRLSNGGQLLFDMMQLNRVSQDEIAEVQMTLSLIDDSVE